eukprot:COSAG06_NODE_1150_length_10499_cov_45.337115_3_plen_67_part_00
MTWSWTALATPGAADGRRRCGAAAGGVAQALALALLAATGLARLSHGACAIGFAGGARARQVEART